MQGAFYMAASCHLQRTYGSIKLVVGVRVHHLLLFPHKNDVRFVFTSSCLQEDACLFYVISVCLRIVVPNTYCVCFRRVYPMLLVSLDCPFLIAAPLVFSKDYLLPSHLLEFLYQARNLFGTPTESPILYSYHVQTLMT